MKVMVAVPTNEVKHYCLGKLVLGLRNLVGADRIVFADDTRADDTIPHSQRSQMSEMDLERKSSYADMIHKLGFEVIDVVETKEIAEKPRIRQRLVNTRKALRKKFLESDCTHMLFLDSDIIPPKYVIPDLVRHNVDIVSGVYWQMDSDGKSRPVIYKYFDKDNYKAGIDNYGQVLSIDDLVPSRVLGLEDDTYITAIGFGCVMLSRKVLEDQRWDFRWDEKNPDKPTTEDMWWSLDIKGLGYNIYCDTAVLCKHYPKAWVGAV